MNGTRSEGRPNAVEVERRRRAGAAALFAFGLLSSLLALSFPGPAAWADPIERDCFSTSTGEIRIDTPMGPDLITLSWTPDKPTIVEVDLGSLADTDGDGREQVKTEIVQMELTGMSGPLGPVTVRVPQTEHPCTPADRSHCSLGELEETTNNTPGVLDIPPFTATGTADSSFDVFFEMDVPWMGARIHNDPPDAAHMVATITHKPPVPGETYGSTNVIPFLYDQWHNYVPVTVVSERHTPGELCPGGGVVELYVDSAGPSARTGESSSPSSPPYATIAGIAAACGLALAAGGWYARRRLS